MRLRNIFPRCILPDVSHPLTLLLVAVGPFHALAFGSGLAVVPTMEMPTSGEDIVAAERATPRHVGAVMALLATFEEAGALPLETSPEANQLIKALIQFQAVFMRSAHPQVRAFFSQALEHKLRDRAAVALTTFRADGWSSEALEAVADFSKEGSSDDHGLEEGLREYNLGLNDLSILRETFHTARKQLCERGQDIHAVYALRRGEMPGAKD